MMLHVATNSYRLHGVSWIGWGPTSPATSEAAPNREAELTFSCACRDFRLHGPAAYVNYNRSCFLFLPKIKQFVNFLWIPSAEGNPLWDEECSVRAAVWLKLWIIYIAVTGQRTYHDPCHPAPPIFRKLACLIAQIVQSKYCIEPRWENCTHATATSELHHRSKGHAGLWVLNMWDIPTAWLYISPATEIRMFAFQNRSMTIKWTEINTASVITCKPITHINLHISEPCCLQAHG